MTKPKKTRLLEGEAFQLEDEDEQEQPPENDGDATIGGTVDFDP